jgi:predicted ribosomally synthesized peptide with nif11-like leader
MSLEFLAKVKEFIVRMVKDEDFRAQLMSGKVEQIRTAMLESGYNFSTEEFETATLKILELKEAGEFHELSEAELVGAVGGYIRRPPTMQQMYGVIWWPPKPYPKPLPQPEPCPKPIDVQPMYGVVIEAIYIEDPIEPSYQQMHGVIGVDK